MKIVIQLVCFAGFLFIPALTFGARDTYHVTQSGAGSKNGTSLANAWDVSQFNALTGTGYAGDTFYFSGTITTEITPQISGTSSNYVTLDGWSGGSYNATDGNHTNLTSICEIKTSSDGMTITGKDYITIQDFYFNGNNGAMTNGLVIWNTSGDDDATHITVKDCYFTEQRYRGVFCTKQTGTHGSSYITVGGARGDGIECYNVGTDTAGYDVKMNYCTDFIVSYNKLWAAASGSIYGISGISWGDTKLETQNGLIEYNYVAQHNASGVGEDGIAGKGGSNLIIRFNYIYAHTNQGQGKGFGAWGDFNNIYIYGNYAKGNDLGAWIVTGATAWNSNGIDGTNAYVFSNIIEGSLRQEGLLIGGWGGSDYVDNIYVYNNTIFGNSVNPVNSQDCGINISGNVRNLYVKNNILKRNRPSAGVPRQLYMANEQEDETEIEYNHFYQPSSTALVYYGASGDVNPTTIGSNNKLGDPGLSDPSNGDFTIASDSSAAVDSGTAMGVGNIATVMIQGTAYSIPWGAALDPELTDWSVVPPKVSVVDQHQYGNKWDVGAYVWTGDPATYLLSPTNLRLKVTP